MKTDDKSKFRIVYRFIIIFSDMHACNRYISDNINAVQLESIM